ncbi:MAG TPA: deoxyribose-phosphate aldolase [Planctomycetes bacterium]|nr:deoxyribose-phosphate aldolase [Planctomycetota bacterium]|tara:strand:+ start:564 stop:1463 length:900 start_codon:yes stop_codon:yes gene_type:complete
MPVRSGNSSVFVDPVMVAQRASSFTRRSIKQKAKIEGLRLAVSMVDLTTLEGKDSPGKVRALCRKAVRPDPGLEGIPSVAAVCVYPAMVTVAHEALSGSGVRVASVATGFPAGQTSLESRLDEVRSAVGDGAEEIDMVISRGALLTGDASRVTDEVRQVKSVCGSAHLKVILETGELETLDRIAEASRLAIAGGADFIKTSTGKVAPAATMEAGLVMLEAIRDHFLKTGKVVGMKPAGGIRTAKEALHWLVMVKETLGNEWLTPERFRFGASSLLDDILRQLHKQASGNYAASYDVPEA